MALTASTSVFAGKAVATQSTQIRSAKRASVVVKASAQSNKAVSLFAAGAVVLSAGPALALNSIELTDQRVTNKAGLQLIYEARDLNLDEGTKGAGASRFAFQKLTNKQSLTRASESVSRFNGDMKTYIDKKYWTQAANEMRRQVGTLRFDVNNLVGAKGEGSADAAKLYKSIEKLDFAIRSKDQAKAQTLLVTVQDQGNALLKSLA